MYVGIKDGKIYDICSDLRHKRTEDENVKYIETSLKDLTVNDTWDNDISLKDSPIRFETNIIIPKSKAMINLEARISKIEK